MKINTDGVILAAIVHQDEPKNILDIGTGTGVIALMLAQRFASAQVEAVEIDEQASTTALRNFKLSVFSNRLSVKNIAIEQFQHANKYDLIVSNPPFFVNDLKNEEKRKGIARHADEDFFSILIKKSISMLSDAGKIWLILPVKQANEVIEIATASGINLVEKVHIHSDKSKKEFRQIICFSKEQVNFKEYDFFIYESLKVHTEAYKNLLKDFFLAY
ncbi:tRNA1(Val) (adenine(37)-N6)-methyltransferase [Pedobacter mendelii]|uniref:tRNA1(Val) (Adenine(37)-N6)-methyltransferase n=1 Tax=Pedobacter mendelii TaxID=1908240 RepID=A0ABQ2BJY5_9SPHI|nr:methyltransferase [Pedobacter mendelii]GGI25274.1 tRNA1(Val) (adenine(37)-N6)-methyltransferase [Pedobacter mendelii]